MKFVIKSKRKLKFISSSSNILKQKYSPLAYDLGPREEEATEYQRGDYSVLAYDFGSNIATPSDFNDDEMSKMLDEYEDNIKHKR